MKLMDGRKRDHFLFFLFMFYGLSTPSMLWANQTSHFPIPPFLADNVLFWKKVYTDVSIEDGLIHDREYPLIIYQRITVGSRWGKNLDTYVDTYKKRIANVLRKIPTKPPQKRSPEENHFAAMFQEYSSIKDIPQAIGRIRFQRGLRESFLKGLEQSGMYIDEIFSMIKRQHLPLRLAYLPHVESSFNIKAVSKAGAVGLWQFMTATGKRYLDIDRHIDERLDPILSSEAALKLLKQNYSELKSWPLAITAYNYGLGGIKRAVRQTGSTDIEVIIRKHKSRSFQFASKNFYSCFLAACEIDENYQRYFKLVNMATPLLRKRFVLKNPMRPIDICEQLQISLSEFRALNPAYKPSLFKQKAPIPQFYTVFLPLSVSSDDYSDIIYNPPPQQEEQLLDEQKTPIVNSLVSVKKPQYEKDVPTARKSLKYRVKKGDSLWQIAKKFGVEDATLRKINGLSRRSYIYPGQVIKVPMIIPKKSQKKRTMNKKSVVSKMKNSPKKSSFTERFGTSLWKKYTVKSGDTLWDIANVIGISPKELKQINRLHNQRLQPGQVLFFPQTKDKTAKHPLQASNKKKIAMKRIRQMKTGQMKIGYYYKVKPGDTLKTIASQTGIAVEKIALINHMQNDYRVYEGQVLRIPKQ